jgi:hypothetical protein
VEKWKTNVQIHTCAFPVSTYLHSPKQYGNLISDTLVLDAVDKVFEKILLNRFPWEVNKVWLLPDDQFGFRPRHTMMQLLDRHIESVNKNPDEKRLTVAVILHVCNAFDGVNIKDLLQKLAVPNFPPFLVKVMTSYLDCRTFETFFQPATHVSSHADWDVIGGNRGRF